MREVISIKHLADGTVALKHGPKMTRVTDPGNPRGLYATFSGDSKKATEQRGAMAATLENREDPEAPLEAQEICDAAMEAGYEFKELHPTALKDSMGVDIVHEHLHAAAATLGATNDVHEAPDMEKARLKTRFDAAKVIKHHDAKQDKSFGMKWPSSWSREVIDSLLAQCDEAITAWELTLAGKPKGRSIGSAAVLVLIGCLLASCAGANGGSNPIEDVTFTTPFSTYVRKAAPAKAPVTTTVGEPKAAFPEPQPAAPAKPECEPVGLVEKAVPPTAPVGAGSVGVVASKSTSGLKNLFGGPCLLASHVKNASRQACCDPNDPACCVPPVAKK